MARMMAKAKTSRINRNATLAPCDASAYCKDLDRWARSWMGVEKDLPPGEALVAHFRPFIENLASSGLAPRTIRRHVDNLWLLGGEIIRDLNYNPSLRKKTAEQLLRHLPQTPQIPHSIPALSPAVTRKFPGRGEILGIEPGVPQEFETNTMETVGAGLGGDIDLNRRIAILSR